MPWWMTRQREKMRLTPLGVCISVIVNEKPLEKTTSSVLSVLLLIYVPVKHTFTISKVLMDFSCKPPPPPKGYVYIDSEPPAFLGLIIVHSFLIFSGKWSWRNKSTCWALYHDMVLQVTPSKYFPWKKFFILFKWGLMVRTRVSSSKIKTTKISNFFTDLQSQ